MRVRTRCGIIALVDAQEDVAGRGVLFYRLTLSDTCLTRATGAYCLSRRAASACYVNSRSSMPAEERCRIVIRVIISRTLGGSYASNAFAQPRLVVMR